MVKTQNEPSLHRCFVTFYMTYIALIFCPSFHQNFSKRFTHLDHCAIYNWLCRIWWPLMSDMPCQVSVSATFFINHKRICSYERRQARKVYFCTLSVPNCYTISSFVTRSNRAYCSDDYRSCTRGGRYFGNHRWHGGKRRRLAVVVEKGVHTIEWRRDRRGSCDKRTGWFSGGFYMDRDFNPDPATFVDNGKRHALTKHDRPKR